MKVDRAKLIQAVQAGRKGMGIDDDAYRLKLQMQFNVVSTKDLTDAQLLQLREELSTGRAPTGGRRFRPAAQRKDQRYIYALWRELGDLGGTEVPGRPGLQAFLNAQCGKDAPEMMTVAETRRVAEALKAMIARTKRNGPTAPHSEGEL